MGQSKRPQGVPVNGMLLLDKPSGISSNQALQKAKALLNARKAGHTGSLDPIATGLLPLCFGETTKISNLFLTADKTYEVVVRLGVATETGDCEGEIVEKNDVDIALPQLEQVLEGYRGQFNQIPPMYSALKRNGQPLYKLARQGIVVERESRPVTVYSLLLNHWEQDLLQLTVSCSRGFYIRVLAEDIGRDLGCGAHVESLRRTRVGDFSISRTLTLEQIEAIVSPQEREKILLPTDQGLAHLPEVRIAENLVQFIRSGQSVKPATNAPSGLVRLYGESSGFLGLGEITEDNRLSPKRLFNL